MMGQQLNLISQGCKLRHNLRYTSVHLRRPLGKVTHSRMVMPQHILAW